MRKFIYIFMIVSALVSCRKGGSSFRGSVDVVVVDTESCPVLVSIGTAGKVTTKGSGVVDEENMWLWKNERINVYAFRFDAPSFTTRSVDNLDVCLVDGTDEGSANAGKLAYVSGGEPYIIWGDEPEQYPKGIKPYHFYAYYLDDWSVTDDQITRTAEKISLPVEIDGSRDIMSARSHVTEKQLNGRGYSPEQKKVLKDHSFCAYSANNNLHPELFFHHHLVRLTFEAYAGRKQGGNICVQELVVETPTKGEFTVVHKDTSKIGIDFSRDRNLVPLALKEEDGAVLRRDHYNVPWKDSFENLDLYSRDKIDVGGSLLVAPTTSYKCYRKLKETINGHVYNHDKEIDLTSTAGKFEGGKQYIIRMAMYGSYEVEPTATVVPWDYGGSIVLDKDEELEEQF